MKVLIGAPIHVCKNYSIERWLQNVAELQQQTPADFFVVDNSPGIDFAEKVKGYCAKYGIKNYEVEHLEIDQALGTNIRIEMSQEMIRRKVISGNYDAWFSWECDQIIPVTALDELVRLMKTSNYMMVAHNCWARWSSKITNTDMGCTLIKKECLEKNWFLSKRDYDINADLSSIEYLRYERSPERVRRNGGDCLEVFGIIKPIYHLDSK